LRRGFLCLSFAVLGLAVAGPAAALERPLPPRVHVAGVKVGGLETAAAARVVQQAFARPLTVVVDKRTFSLRPPRLATPYIDGALRRAKTAQGGNVQLVVSVHGAAVRDVVDRIAQKVEHRAAKSDLALRLRNGKPYIAPGAFGRKLDVGELMRKIVHQLAANTRLPMHFSTQTVEPRVLLTAASRRVIVINRANNVLSLYKGTKMWQQFHVATGQAAYPTPAGRFRIVVKWVNPWWYPPASPWAAGESPVPPGPGNPLGTRWMGLSAPGVGIHGTPQPQSIGYSLSHGCIRMLIPQAEWLFNHVDVGTTVFIV
jgi:lipoprotein-anchoring transpeptidase ErfK/SrfK